MSSPRFFDRRAHPAQNLVHRDTVDLRPLADRERRLVNEAQTLATKIAENDKRSLQHYYDLGKIVADMADMSSSISIRRLAELINRRGFGYSTLSDSKLFHNYVKKRFHGSVQDFIADAERTQNVPDYENSTVSWRYIRAYIIRDRVATSEGEVEADAQFDLKEATKPFREAVELSSRWVREWDALPSNVRAIARGQIKVMRHNLSDILDLPGE